MPSDFAPLVAKYPKSILPGQQFRECASLYCFAPLAMQLVGSTYSSYWDKLSNNMNVGMMQDFAHISLYIIGNMSL